MDKWRVLEVGKDANLGLERGELKEERILVAWKAEEARLP